MMKNRAISLGVVGGLIVIAGVVLSVLIHLMIDVVSEGYRPEVADSDWGTYKTEANGHVWVFGLVYIIPGILVVIAAIVQNKCMYVTACIFAMISMLIMGLFVLIGCVTLFVLILAYGNISEHCQDTNDGCRCRAEGEMQAVEYAQTPFKECHYFSSFASFAIAILIFIILAWVLLLTAFIMAVYYSCRSSPPQSGTVYAPVDEFHAPPSYTYPQPLPPQPMYLDNGPEPFYEGPPSKV